MKILVAGYNLDAEVIEGLKQGKNKRSDITPEVLSASYARISRDPRPIDELRAAARTEVEKARKSNQAIIFKMGHHSVAEHAVFNFDLIDVSRLALEEIEKFRLCSYTEKSQRYQKLEDNYLIPDEIKSAGLEPIFTKTIETQNICYQQMVSAGIPPEDARYITSLATHGQVGMTFNARNLELLFRRFASSQLSEVRQIGHEMYNKIKNIAPSIILFTNATALDANTYRELKRIESGPSASLGVNSGFGRKEEKEEKVRLIDYTKNADDILIASILHTVSNSSYKDCVKAVKKMSKKKKEDIIKSSLKYMEFYDSNIREFEYPDLTYEIILSAACFGQLKRHRIATLTCQEYNPSLGITMPSTIVDKGLQKYFARTIKLSENTYKTIYKKAPNAAQYILTNAHRKRVLFKCNARELYHISRLREDKHAQWDIQDISRKMTALAKKAMPITMLTVGGKDSYPEIYEKVFGRKPNVLPIY